MVSEFHAIMNIFGIMRVKNLIHKVETYIVGDATPHMHVPVVSFKISVVCSWDVFCSLYPLTRPPWPATAGTL